MSMPARLNSQGRFERPENKDILFVMFLSVEGNRTEKEYFNFVNKFRDKIGIKRFIEIRVLERRNSDTRSAPQEVLALLREYINLRNDKKFKIEVKNKLKELEIFDKFRDEEIQMFIEGDDKLSTETARKIKNALKGKQLDLEYLYFLNTYKHDADVFGVVIDRDKGSYTRDQLKKLFFTCKENHWYCFLTNPCFEFWLLLHICNIKEEYKECLNLFLKNEKKDSDGKKIKNTFTNEALYQKTNIRKIIQENDFKKYFCQILIMQFVLHKAFQQILLTY